MAKYHKYVFDIENRRFVGQFEKMYQAELRDKFDSWHQDDTRQLQRKIDLLILEQYNFKTIIDIGCGKGTFTHLFKKKNNYVLGIDISETAIKIARERYPDIDFLSCNISNINNYLKLLDNFRGGVELVVCSEVLSYLSNWRELIQAISMTTRFFLVSLYLPFDPIGFVKSAEELKSEIMKYFDLKEYIVLEVSRFYIVFARSKKK
jgi:SAM-dependent methyltransferase